MGIEKLTNEEELPWVLLLEADPNKDFVLTYLKTGTTFVYRDQQNQILGVIVIQKQSSDTYEVMNLSVARESQNKGIGCQLLTYALEKISQEPQISLIIIKTGDLPSPALRLYKNCGFVVKEIIYDYFVDHYPEPLYENGQQLKNQVVLEKRLNYINFDQ